MSTHEPPIAEVRVTRLMGRLLSPLYKSYARSLRLKGNERVIDFGSGVGNLSRHLAAILNENGGQLTCVDVSHTWQTVIREELKDFSNVRYVEGEIGSLDLPNQAFDAIVVHFVLHDIPESERRGIAQCLISNSCYALGA
jgi:ubiquinone/menaquinone biosynthesis C-methylase UbiE